MARENAFVSRRMFVALGGATLLAPSATWAQATPPRAAIRAASAADDDVTPFLYAQQSGIFQRVGIDADIQRAKSGSAVAAGVVGGTFDLGKASLLGLISAHVHNVPLVLIAPAGEYDAAAPISALVVKTNSPISSAADLNGKTIAVSSLNDLHTLSTKAWLDQHGGDSRTIRLVELPISAVPEAIAQGRIDAGSILEPELEFALESGKVRVLGRAFDAIARRFLFTAWFCTAEFATKNRPLVDRFVRGMREAAAYTNLHHSETANMLAKFTLVDSKIILKATRATAGLTLDPKQIQPIIDAAVKYKIIGVSFDARDLLDPALAPLK